ncbi:MAG: uncharacterized membrane protein YccF (DUF307 family) [Haloarculaceae archaeon]|jgi:uncharacterized membrane protein YccF (DUF307 family)
MGVLLRTIWFLLIGWWLAILWMGISFLFMLTVIGFPVGLYLLSKTWQIATFKR